MRNVVAILLLPSVVVLLGRILYAVALTVAGIIAELWMSPEEIGSVMWAYRKLISVSDSLPYLIWGLLAGVLAAYCLNKQSIRTIRGVFLAIAIGMWIHKSHLAIFSMDHWETSWVLELFWIAIFLPLFWVMPRLLKWAETGFATGGGR